MFPECRSPSLHSKASWIGIQKGYIGALEIRIRSVELSIMYLRSLSKIGPLPREHTVA